MYVLRLNDMRAAHSENLEPVARAETTEQLHRFLQGERVESYTDGVDGASGHYGDGVAYNKAFRVGGPLEWYNPPSSIGGEGDCPPDIEINQYSQEEVVQVPTREEAIATAGPQWDRQIGVLPDVALVITYSFAGVERSPGCTWCGSDVQLEICPNGPAGVGPCEQPG